MQGFIRNFIIAIAVIFSGSMLLADIPHDWQISFQDPATPVMERIVWLHHLVLWVQVIISAFVALMLFYIVWKFSAKRNPKPSTVTHNTVLEVIWTAIPVVILLVIAFPSLKLLYYMDVTPKADLTIKAIGNQWYWTYEYPDHDIKFDSLMVEDKNLTPDQHRLFDVDNRVVVPVGVNIRLITTATDVLHSWAVPSFGVKRDSVPGRINETWFNVKREGVYYGQCSELCGVKHGFMPIVVEAVSVAKFKNWLEQHKPAAPAQTPETKAPAINKTDEKSAAAKGAPKTSSSDKSAKQDSGNNKKEGNA